MAKSTSQYVIELLLSAGVVSAAVAFGRSFILRRRDLRVLASRLGELAWDLRRNGASQRQIDLGFIDVYQKRLWLLGLAMSDSEKFAISDALVVLQRHGTLLSAEEPLAASSIRADYESLTRAYGIARTHAVPVRIYLALKAKLVCARLGVASRDLFNSARRRTNRRGGTQRLNLLRRFN